MPSSAVIVHAVIVAVLVAAYTVLTVTGHDANAVLAVIAGQATGAGVQAATSKPGSGNPAGV